MKRLILILISVGFTIYGHAQTREIIYTYDENGNRDRRSTVYLRTAQNPDDPTENIQSKDAFDEEDGVLAMIDNARFTVYPNPTTSIIRAEWQMEDGDFVPIKEVRLMGLNGKIIRELSNPSLPLDVDMQNLPNGTYILWIMPEKGDIQRVKVVKQ
ncbi:MAG: T9SS type A sorting domain-containing protein [Wenzhouxiangella sp.]|nr:T9SS type A sorting domain-containing protein [Wenzhouxiangella sp.]